MENDRFDAAIRGLGSERTRRGVLGILVGLAGVGLGEAAAKGRHSGKSRRRRAGAHRVQAAAADKVSLCHYEGNGTWHSITVAKNAAAKHIANHGDVPYDAKRGQCCTDADCGVGATCILVDNGDGTQGGICSCLSDGVCCGTTRLIECALRCCPGSHPVDSPDCGGPTQLACVAN